MVSSARPSSAIERLVLIERCPFAAFEPKYEDLQHEPIRFMETATRAFHAEDDHFVDNDKLPEDFYSSDAYAEKLISYLSERDAKEKAQPFFAYLPFSAPHWPLQGESVPC